MYQTKPVDFNIEGIPIKILRVTNVDELMDEFMERDPEDETVKDEQFPYWADLWHSAISMGRYLVKNNLITKGTKVTEIGCGLGFTGIVAGKLGGDVIFTDYLQEAVDFAKKNWQLNCENPARFELMDWRKPNPDFAADVVLAADVAYEVRNFEPLLNTFSTICKPGGCIIIGEPNRKVTSPFIEALKKSDFEMKIEVYEEQLDDALAKVNVIELKRNESIH